MQNRFKKFIAYTLATSIMFPAWFALSLITAPKVHAQSVKDRTYSISDTSFFGDWQTHYSGAEMYTLGSVDDTRAVAEFSDVVSLDPGLYKIEAQWRVYDDHTTAAKYVIKDNGTELDKIIVNQKLRADGEEDINGVFSGYKDLGTYNLSGNHSKLVLLGHNPDNGNVSFMSVRISHQNVVPSTPVLTSPADGANAQDKQDFFWTSVSDSDDSLNPNTITYELELDGAIVPLSVSNPYTTFKMSTTNWSEGIHSWRVRAFDGEDYSEWSASRTLIKPDETNPIIDSVTATPALPGHISKIKVTAHDNIALSYAEISFDGGSTFDPMVGSDSPFTFEYTVPSNTTGPISFGVTVYDQSGNFAFGNGTIETEVPLAAPVITAIQGTGKSITVSFEGVGGDVTKYEIYINGVYREVTALSNDSGHLYTVENIEVGEYGTYDVYVKAVSDLQSVDSNTVSVNVSAPAPVVAPSAPSSSIISSASASDTAAVTEEENNEQGTLKLDDNGKIKGEEDNSDETTDTINWTPWIILFILIILAGAATGGYFYWFGGEEEITKAAPVVAAKKKEKKEEAKDNKSDTPKKPRRW